MPNITQTPPILLDGTATSQLQRVSELHNALKTKMSAFVLCKEIKNSVFEGDEQLVIEPIDGNGMVKLSYAGETIRLTPKVVFRDGDAHGKIVCTHEIATSVERQNIVVGEFSIDQAGRTNFTDHNGRLHFLHESADLIAASFFSKVFAGS